VDPERIFVQGSAFVNKNGEGSQSPFRSAYCLFASEQRQFPGMARDRKKRQAVSVSSHLAPAAKAASALALEAHRKKR
jgi:hypothetical protein